MLIDLNADIAEACGNDYELLRYISSANIACGVHAGDAVHMLNALEWAKENGVRIGAHPSFPDRENFGRHNMDLPERELKAHILYQLGAIQALCDQVGTSMAYVKPHGALYNQAAKNETLANILAETIKAFNPNLKLMGLSGSVMIKVAQNQGIKTISEVFADRRYMPDGSLVPRSRPDAVLQSDEEAMAQVLLMAQQGAVIACDGSRIDVRADSVCLHGDGAHALVFAQKIVRALNMANIRIQAI